MWHTITVTQPDWDGLGNDRIFHFYARPRELDSKLQRIRLMFGPRITITIA